MKIAITGVAGFIGSHLTDVLLARGHQVVGVDNLAMGHLRNIEHHQGCSKFEFHKIDVRDFAAMRDVFRGADTIVHLAAFKIPRYGNAIETIDVNTQGSRHVLEIARDGNKRVLLASTSDIYGKNPNSPMAENSDSVLGPTSVARWSYAVSKLWDEHTGMAYNSSYGVPVTILRFFGSYGPRQHLSWWGGPQSVFISAILKDEEVEIHGDGLQTRSFTYISDLVDGIARAVDYNGTPAIVFNLGNTHEITILELAKLVKESCGTPQPLRIKMIPYATFGGNYEDVRRRVPDIGLARKVLQFNPTVGIEEGLTYTVKWQRTAMGLG
jgi:UDP-glucose 4-epimerase